MIVTEVQGPFTGYVETAWCTLPLRKGTLVIVCDPVLVVVVFVRDRGKGREYTFEGGEVQMLLKGRYVKIVVKGEGDGYVRLVG